MTARIEDWEAAMARVIAEHEAAPAQWGVSDCFRFPADVAAAIIGGKPIFAGVRYSTEAGAAKAMKRRGFDGIGDVFASAFQEAPVMTFRRGDIGVAMVGDVAHGCVVTGAGLAIKGPSGLTFAPLSHLQRLFLVGD